MIKYSLRYFILLFWTMTYCILPLVIAGERDTVNVAEQKKRGYKICFVIGGNDGPTSDQIEQIMKKTGFQSVSADFIFGSTTYPFSEMNGIPWMVSVEIPIPQPFVSKVMMSNSLLKHSKGSSGMLGASLDFEYSVLTLAPTIQYYFINNILFCGIGPSFNIISFDESGRKSELQSYGAVTDLGINITLSRSFLVTLTAQYRFVGKMNIGPYQSSYTTGIATANPVTTTLTFPQSEISFSHIFFGVGIGFQ